MNPTTFNSSHESVYLTSLQAKEMVALADSVTRKLEEKKGSLTEDEVSSS